MMLLAVGLWAVMPERHFHPTPRGDRETFGHLKDQLVAGLRIARGRQVVRVFLLVSLLVGLASEVFDRLWRVRVLDTFAMPALFGGDEAIAFTVFALIGTVVSLAASLASGRWLPRRVVDTTPVCRWPCRRWSRSSGSSASPCSGTCGSRSPACGCAAPRWRSVVPSSRRGSTATSTAPTRATVLSMNSQANAIGQVAGGPPLGALATRTSIPVALVVAAVVQAPTVLAILRVRRTAGTTSSVSASVPVE